MLVCWDNDLPTSGLLDLIKPITATQKKLKMLSSEILNAGNGLATIIRNKMFKTQQPNAISEIRLVILRRKILN